MNKKALTLIEIVIASMVLVTIIIYSLLAFNNVLFLSEHSSNFSLAMESAKAMLEEIKSKSLETIKSDYSGYTFDILDKSGNLLGKGRVDVEDLSGKWTETVSSAPWSKRGGAKRVVFNNKMWIMGGWWGDYLNDVWYSSDGINWVKATDNAGWSGRAHFGVVVFDNKIWVMGGHTGSGYVNDVWYSSDGINWVKVTDNAGWSPRAYFGTVVFDNKIWVMGGAASGPGNVFNDVWYSSDGVNWIKATDNAGWSERAGFGTVVFNNKIWVIGDNDKSDVWYSSDGINWVKVTDNAGWTPRVYFGTVVFDNKIWVIGGDDVSGGSSNYLNDVWYSQDGINWTKATDHADWSERETEAIVFNNKIWIIGGENFIGGFPNDAWYTSGYNRLLKIKITCCWKEKGGRIIGEDKNLNGQLDIGEDINGNGELDSPVKLVTYIANKEFPQRVFLIEK